MIYGSSTFPGKPGVSHMQLRQQTNTILYIMFTFYNYRLVIAISTTCLICTVQVRTRPFTVCYYWGEEYLSCAGKTLVTSLSRITVTTYYEVHELHAHVSKYLSYAYQQQVMWTHQTTLKIWSVTDDLYIDTQGFNICIKKT